MRMQFGGALAGAGVAARQQQNKRYFSTANGFDDQALTPPYALFGQGQLAVAVARGHVPPPAR